MASAEDRCMEPLADPTDSEEELRRGTRERKLTEKARQNKEDMLITHFWRLCKDFASRTTNVEIELRAQGHHELSSLEEMKTLLNKEFKAIEDVYEQLMGVSISVPTQDIRHRVDQLQANRNLLVRDIERRLDECDKRSTCSSQSRQSSSNTQRIQDAEANAAARRVALCSQMEEASKEEEIRLMELEVMERRTKIDMKMLHV